MITTHESIDAEQDLEKLRQVAHSLVTLLDTGEVDELSEKHDALVTKLERVRDGFDSLLQDVAPADQDLPEGDDHQFWLGVTQAVAVFEQATGLYHWGYYDPEAPEQLTLES
jgi:hypothetical protein